MKTNISIIFMRVTLVLVFLIRLLICSFWYPFSVTLSSDTGILDYDPSEITFQQNVEFYCQLLFYWIISLPCFAVVLMVFINTVYARKGGTFNKKSANILLKMGLILFISSIIFLIVNFVFMSLGWNKFINLYLAVGILGLVFSAGIYAVHKYIAKGAANNAGH